MKDDKYFSKLLHDMNSSMTAIEQSLNIINESWKKNEDLVERVLPLTKEKFSTLMNDWEKLKIYIKNDKNF